MQKNLVNKQKQVGSSQTPLRQFWNFSHLIPFLVKAIEELQNGDIIFMMLKVMMMMMMTVKSSQKKMKKNNVLACKLLTLSNMQPLQYF